MSAQNMISVNIFKELHTIAMEYSETAFSKIALATQGVFFAAVGIWWLFILFQYVRGKRDLGGILEHVLVITGVSVCLVSFRAVGFSTFYEGFYAPVHALTTGVSQILLATVPEADGVAGDSILSLLWTLEREVDKLIGFQKLMSGAVAWYNLSAHIMLFLVLLPYLFVWLIFLAYSLNYIFKITAITVLGPVMVALFPFSSLRKYAYAMVQVVASGALTLVFASVAMGFTLHLFHHYMGLLPLTETGELKAELVNEFIFSSNFVALFAFGGVSVLFHLKAPVLARAITGVADGPGAEGFVAGMGATAIAVSKRMVVRSANRVVSVASAATRRSGGSPLGSLGQSGSRLDPTKTN